MTTITVNNPFPFFTDTNGKALENGNIYIGVAGLDAKTNPITAYWDDARTITAAQPIRTVEGYPDNSGSPSNFFTASDFSITIEDKTDVLIYSKLRMNTNELALFKLVASEFKDVPTLIADTALDYNGISAGDIIQTRAENFSYSVAASGATDQHLTTAGGVKLYVLSKNGAFPFDAFNAPAQTFMPLIGDDNQMQPRHIDGGSDDLFLLVSESPVISGLNLPGFSIRNGAGAALNLGSRASSASAYTQQQSRTGVVVDGYDAFNSGDVSGSTYGLSVVALGARVTNFSIDSVTLPTGGGDDSEGLYTKVQDSFIWGGSIADSGRESAYSVKGAETGDTSGPAGFGNLIGGILFKCSPTFAAADGGSNKQGMKIQCGDNVFQNMRFDGWTGAAWYTASGVVNSFSISSVEVYNSGAAGNGAVRILCEGGTYRVNNHHVENPTASAYEVGGQAAAATAIFTNATCKDVNGRSFSLAPTAGNALTVEIRGGHTDGATGDFINMSTGRLAKLLVDGHQIEGISGAIVTANTSPHEIVWRNSPVEKVTTDATTTTVITLPVPTDGAGSGTVTVKGTSGTDVFIQTFEVAHSNTAGVATEEGENAGTALASAGAATWLAALNVSGGGWRVRVTGAAATTIKWVVDIDYHGNS